MNVKCNHCHQTFKKQGLHVHIQRAHNPNNNYGSRKGMRFRYDADNKRRMTDVSDEPPIKPNQLLIDRPNITAWERMAKESHARIVAKYK
jgi:hypothetical protein